MVSQRNLVGSDLYIERNPKTLKVLAQFVKNEEEDTFVREATYAAMRKVIQYDPREQLHLATHTIDFTME